MIVPGIGTVVGGVIGGVVGAISSLFGGSKTNPDTTAWNSFTQGSQSAAAQNPNTLASTVSGLWKSGDNSFPGLANYQSSNQFTGDMTKQIDAAVDSGKIAANATPQQMYSQVVQPWLSSMPGGQQWSKDPKQGAQSALITDLISNYQQGKPIMGSSSGTVPYKNYQDISGLAPTNTSNPAINLANGIAEGADPLTMQYLQKAAAAAPPQQTAQAGVTPQQVAQAPQAAAQVSQQRQQTQQGTSPGAAAGIAVGATAGAALAASGAGNSTMMDSTGQGGILPGISNSNLLGGLGYAAQAGLGYLSATQQSGMQTGAYNLAGQAGNSGNNYSATGVGGVGGMFNNGALTLNGGAMTGTANGFGQFGTNQTNMANMFGNGNVPSNVTQGFNNYNNQLNTSQMFNGMGQGTSAGVMNMGANQLGQANANFSGAYNTALTAGQQALNPQIQQQSNALLNSNFERGMSGTSGGALQTQALQNSFNTAELQNQSNAFNQANSIYNSTINAGTSMFNTGAGQLGNFNNAGAGFGQQGQTAAMNYNMYSPQLAGAYNTNAINAVNGFNGINQGATAVAGAGLAGTTNMGNQMNKAAGTQGQIANTWNGGAAGAGSTIAGAFGNMLTGGNTGMLSGVGGAVGNYLNGSNSGSGFNSMSNFNSPGSNGDTSNLGIYTGNNFNSYGAPNSISNAPDTSSGYDPTAFLNNNYDLSGGTT
jgi:hypothetical protein